MTEGELDNPKVFFGANLQDKDIARRRERVARGAGCRTEHVNELLDEHKRFAKMVEKVGKSGLMNGDMNAMMRNPKQMQQMLSKTIDPKMLSKLGGAGNMMEMMKEMSAAEGPMGAMMKQMQ